MGKSLLLHLFSIVRVPIARQQAAKSKPAADAIQNAHQQFLMSWSLTADGSVTGSVKAPAVAASAAKGEAAVGGWVAPGMKAPSLVVLVFLVVVVVEPRFELSKGVLRMSSKSVTSMPESFSVIDPAKTKQKHEGQTY